MHLTVLPVSPPDRAGAVVRQCSNANPAKRNLALNNVNNILADLGVDQVG